MFSALSSEAPREEEGPLWLTWHVEPSETMADGWLHTLMQLEKLALAQAHQVEHRLQFVPRLAYSVDPQRNNYRNSGDERLAHIMRDLDRFGVVRTDTQKLFHFWFTQSVLELIYDNEWDSSATRVLATMGLERTWTEVMAMTPRRFGKT